MTYRPNLFTVTAPVAGSGGLLDTTGLMATDGSYFTALQFKSYIGVVGGVPTLTLTAPSAPTAATAFAMTATLANYSAQPVLTYSVDGAAFAALPTPTYTPSTGAPTSVSWTEPGLTAAAHTLQIKDGNGVLSNTLTITPTAAAVAAPGQVTALAVGTLTSTTAPLTWTAPSTGGAVTGNLVEYQPSGGSWTTAASGVTGTGYTVTGLTAATAYLFRVTASNGTGSGAASATAGGTTAAAAVATYVLTQWSAGSTTATASFAGNAYAGASGQTKLANTGGNGPTQAMFVWTRSSTVAPTFGTSDVNTTGYMYSNQNSEATTTQQYNTTNLSSLFNTTAVLWKKGANPLGNYYMWALPIAPDTWTPACMTGSPCNMTA